MKNPSWTCQRCGEPIGWLCRFALPFLHTCKFPSLGHVPPRPLPAPAPSPSPLEQLMLDAEHEHFIHRGAYGPALVLAKRIIELEARVAKLEKR